MRGTKSQVFVTGGGPFKSMSEPSTELESKLQPDNILGIG